MQKIQVYLSLVRNDSDDGTLMISVTTYVGTAVGGDGICTFVGGSVGALGG